MFLGIDMHCVCVLDHSLGQVTTFVCLCVCMCRFDVFVCVCVFVRVCDDDDDTLGLSVCPSVFGAQWRSRRQTGSIPGCYGRCRKPARVAQSGGAVGGLCHCAPFLQCVCMSVCPCVCVSVSLCLCLWRCVFLV